MNEFRCFECKALLFQSPNDSEDRCPVCEATGLVAIARIQDVVPFSDGTRVKAYKGSGSKFSVDMRSGPSYYRVDSQWHHLVRVIDRENDHYSETVRVLATGELIRKVDMPLSQHIGRGGSKNQGA